MRRRTLLKTGFAAGSSLFAADGSTDRSELLKFLCPPDGTPPDLLSRPSPPSRPFVAPLNLMPVKLPVPKLDPPLNPRAHQLYREFTPKVFYEISEGEFLWKYHPDSPYGTGSWSWGFDGMTPGPTYHARYGEPVLVRRINNLPTVGNSKVSFALPSTTSHLHNAHTASESDGNPADWIDPGEFWDHHYCNFPSGQDPLEKLTTLWYHDHRLDFTAANVYAGLNGFYLLFDEQDSGNERDTNPAAFRLPSGKYDIPIILHDVLFDANGQVVFDPFNTDGILGDKYTANRTIQPFLQVEARKYRFRILNGGPSRFYQLYLQNDKGDDDRFTVVTGDGNFLPEPVEAHGIFLSVAQRYDVIVDFSRYKPGDHVYLQNRLEQSNGKGPSGRVLDPSPEQSVMRFDVISATGEDPSRLPDTLRPLPQMLKEVKRRRVWDFDYNGGLWTINGKVYDPNRIDAGIEKGTAEIWTLRNQGKNWSHPIHSHFVEYLLLEVNGIPVTPTSIEDAAKVRRREWREYEKGKRTPIDVFRGGRRRDIATLLPGDEIVIYMRWSDFVGKYVMHCHNVVHEDHSMMIRWDVVEQGQGFDQSRPAVVTEAQPHLEVRPASSTFQADQPLPPAGPKENK